MIERPVTIDDFPIPPHIVDADGLCVARATTADDAHEIAAALNDHAALQAQVAELTAERDRLREQVAAVRMALAAVRLDAGELRAIVGGAGEGDGAGGN